MAIMAMMVVSGESVMRSVNVAELRDHLSAYIRFAKKGEEIVIRERNLPVAKLVPFEAGDATEEELLLVAEGKMRLPRKPMNVEEFLKLPIPRVKGNAGTEALLKDREESL